MYGFLYYRKFNLICDKILTELLTCHVNYRYISLSIYSSYKTDISKIRYCVYLKIIIMVKDLRSLTNNEGFLFVCLFVCLLLLCFFCLFVCFFFCTSKFINECANI